MKILYSLDEFFLSCLYGVGLDSEIFVDTVEYEAGQLNFLRRLADFDYGICSDDILSTVFLILDPKPFDLLFDQWREG